MDGEFTLMADLWLKLTANLIQQALLIGFLFMFFDKPESKVKRVAPLAVTAFLSFALTIYFTLHGMTISFLYYVLATVILLLYAVLFLKGKLYLRIIIPIAVSNILIAYMNVIAMCTFGRVPFAEQFVPTEWFWDIILFTVNPIYGAFLYIIYRFGKGRISIHSHVDILAFIVMPMITCAAGITTLLAFENVGYDPRIQVHITIISFSLAALTMIFWYLFVRVSRDTQIRADLLMTKQREELYKKSVLTTNEQIEKISEVKHDTKNILMTAGVLIAQGEYDKARALCERETERLNEARTPVNSDNPILNAILNVELEKAASLDIVCEYEIGDSLGFMDDTDIVSVIGNLCDNAIEYLSSMPPERRRMSLLVDVRNDYCRIVCKNTISGSVLGENPTLRTTKKDSTFHGKGVVILKQIAQSYLGDVVINEENEVLTVAVVVSKKERKEIQA